jgi:predicted ABC-class ATPase
MASPPAIPFEAPKDSTTRQEIIVEMGLLCSFLPKSLAASTVGGSETAVSLTGLVIPAGITLIVGGGYHGKVSTNVTSILSLPTWSGFLTALHCC